MNNLTRNSPIRVALIQAPLGRKEPLVYPLGLSLLASAIRKTCDVRIIDSNLVGLEKEADILRDFDPQVIGISIRNIDSQMRRDLFYYYPFFRQHIRKIRTWFPSARIILGGSGFSLFPEAIMKENPEADLGVYLEADGSFPELLENLDDPEKVKGIFYRSGNHVLFSGDRLLPTSHQFLNPQYDLCDPKPYEKNGGIGVQTKRGCPMKCIYCTYPYLNGDCFRARPLEMISSEIHNLYETYGIKEFTFVDGIFNLPRDRTVQLLDHIKNQKWNIRWRAWFTENGFDKEFALLCRDTGCLEFSFSPDGYSDRTLKALGKNITNKEIQKIYTLAREIEGIRVAFNFFWNPPDQDLRSFVSMLIFTLKCKFILRKSVGGIIFGSPRIEPNTILFHRAVEENIIDPGVNLLPENKDDLSKVFYVNPSTRYLEKIFSVYALLWKLKHVVPQVRNESGKSVKP